MEEKYWNNFMATGRIGDYLSYKGLSAGTDDVKKYADNMESGDRYSVESKGQNSESDDSYRNGAIFRSYR